MGRKIFIGIIICLALLTLMVGISPKMRQWSVQAYQATKKVAGRTYQKVRTTARRLVKTTIVPDECMYKEFSDLSDSSRWAYWYLHSAKQNGIMTYQATDCSSGTINAYADSKIVLESVCRYANTALGVSISCPSGDGDSYPSWNHYLNLGEVKQELTQRGIGTTNPTTPSGTSAPSWSETGCECLQYYCQPYPGFCSDWHCDECEINAATGGGCDVYSPTYTAGCASKAQLISLLDYNLNKPISYKIIGNVYVANNALPVTDLANTKLDFYELNANGSRITPAAASATVVYDGTNQKYEIIFAKPITDFLNKVPGKQFELYVTPGSDKFYPDARIFTINSIVTTINFSLLWKEDFRDGQAFQDVPSNHWAYWYIMSLSQNKVMGGFNGNFYPDSQVIRARTALYSTMAKGSQPCCGAAGDPGTGTTCQTCTESQFYYDLTTDNYFWGYAQSALLAGTMTGYDDQTFRPTENISQQQVWWSMQKGGIPSPQLPAGYTPAYSNSTPITRAQLAALYAWNFNRNLKITIQGNLRAADGTTPAALEGASVSVLNSADRSLIAQTVARYQPATGTTYQIVINKPVQSAWEMFNGPDFLLVVEQTGFKTLEEEFSPIQVLIKKDLQLSKQTVVEENITFNGYLAVHGSCGSRELKNLAGTVIKIFDDSNNTLLGSSLANEEIKVEPDGYANTIIRYSATVKKVASNSYKIMAFQKDYRDTLIRQIITTESVVDLGWAVMKPKKISLDGRVTDATSGLGIKNASVWIYDKYLHTSRQGFYWYDGIELTETADFMGVVVEAPIDSIYLARTHFDVPIYCRNNFADFELASQKICEKPNGTDVEICWWGEEAANLKNNPSYNDYWPTIAKLIEELRSKTATNLIKKINIYLFHRWAAASASYSGDIDITTEMFSDPVLYQALTLFVLNHEYGHHIFFNQAAFEEFEDNFYALFDSSRALVKPDVVAYSQTNVFLLLTPENYVKDNPALSERWPPFGYAGRNRHELFAETFATMFRYDGQLHEEIANNLTIPQDIKDFTKNVHNQEAEVWPHGNTITWDKIKEFLALK